jgi:Tol biopolymer transport system component
MPLTPGTRLGPYEIITPIGAGGMGEVYRARDTRLDRIVAIKTIGGAFSERFEREARAISALNHPHICTLHDIGTEQGLSFLVMEHVEGAEPKGPMPPDQAVRYGIQICEALETAHRAGIVHRDLKPANILVTKQGVKLLDFGIAKLQPAVASASSTADGATIAALTGAHTVIGTPQYMAPEQIEGREADARTDIFAFGCVFYELLSGKAAFDGKSPSAVMASILASEPRPMRELQPITPPALERLVSLCLAKDPGERYQSAHDVKLQLEWIRDAASQPSPTPRAPRLARRERMLWVAALAIVLAGAAGLATRLRPSPAAAPLRVALNLPPGFSLDDANPAIALSPDGQRLALAASGPTTSQRLWVRALSGDQPQALTGTDGATYPFWSPDGRFIGFFASQKLKKVEVASGAVQTICDAPNGRGASWSRDGAIVFAPDYQSGLFTVLASGGTPEELTQPEKGGTHRLPFFLPDDRYLLFFAIKPGSKSEGIMSLDRTTKKTEVVAAESNDGRYVAPGYLLFLRDTNLMAQPFDATSRRTTGSPFVVAENVTTVPSRYTGQFSAVDTSTLVYQQSAGAHARQLTLFGIDGTRLGTVGDPAPLAGNVFISPDGRRAAALATGNAGRSVISIYDLSSGVPTRIAFGPHQGDVVAWSPDGKSLAFVTPEGLLGIQTAGLSSQPRMLISEPQSFSLSVNSWSPDGQSLAILLQPVSGLDLASLPVNGKPDFTPLVEGPGWQMNGIYAPDGKAFVYVSNETGIYEVFVMPLPKSGARLQVTSGGGEHPQWINGGRELAYVNPQRELVAVEMTRTGDQLSIGRSRKLFGGRPLPAQPGPEGDREGASPIYITPDGTKVLLAVPTNLEAVVPLTLVTNWR